MDTFYDWFSAISLWTFLIVNGIYALLLICSIPSIYMRFQELNLEDMFTLLQSESLPSISVVIPCYNEGQHIVQNLQSYMQLFYPSKEIVVVNDGSSDNSLELLIENFSLVKVPPFLPDQIPTKQIRAFYHSKAFPNLIVIDKVNGGSKADAINAGINVSVSSMILVIDADTLVQKDSLLRMIRPFLTHEGTVGQGGTLGILNSCIVEKGVIKKAVFPDNLVPAMQVVEYLRAFLFGRLGWNHLGGNLCISGAFGLFNRSAVADSGGYDTSMVGEDIEMTMRLVKNYRLKNQKGLILFIPDPVAWTYVPDRLRSLGKQRERWHRGLIQAFWKHRSMFLNPRYHLAGLFGMPYLLLGEVLQPVLELGCWAFIIPGIYLGQISWHILLLFLAVTFGLTIIFTLASLIMEMTTFRRYNFYKQLYRIFLIIFIENFGYRQINAIWKLQGFVKYFRRSKEWSK